MGASPTDGRPITRAPAASAGLPRASAVLLRLRPHLLWLVPAVWLLTVVAMVVASLSTDVSLYELGLPWQASVLGFGLAGALILRSQPHHPLGHLFTWSFALLVLGIALYVLAVVSAPSVTGAWFYAAGSALSTVVIAVLVPVGALLFPDGRLPSPRWRAVVWLSLVAAGVGGAAALVTGGWGGSIDQALMPGPLAERFGGAARNVADLVFFPMLALLMIAGGISLILRHRGSSGIERKQLQWLAFAGAILVAVVLVNLVAQGTVDVATESWATVGQALALAGIPAAVGIAILRYRLYDIDLVVNRALVVATLAVFIGAVYIVLVVGLGQLVGSGDEPNTWLSLGATAVVAVAFQPVRRRVRSAVDRLVFGERATPYEVLARFSHESSAAPDGTGLPQRIADVLASGTGASVTVWVRVGDRLVPDASSPDGADPAPAISAVAPTDPRADATVPVLHDGEVLGAISVAKPPGDPLNEGDRNLVEQVAAGMGLLLRNQRLTAELQALVDALERSRGRLLAAADDTRRKIERDLATGPARELERVAGEVADLCTAAREAGGTRTADLLDQVGGDSAHALETIRELASGVYPPRLEAAGLATAVAEHAERAPIPVTVHAPGMGRVPREVERSVYFVVLEALQNAVKYAEASSVHVTLETDDEALRFSVTDDGCGFDPDVTRSGAGLRNLRDRVDALRGEAVVTSRPGRGTTVEGSVPLATSVGVPS